jgi:hypothetical protein
MSVAGASWPDASVLTTLTMSFSVPSETAVARKSASDTDFWMEDGELEIVAPSRHGNTPRYRAVGGRMYTVEDTRDIFYGDHPDFDQDPVADIEGDESRWSQWSTRIYRNTLTGEHWAVDVGQGKTEMQEDEVYDAPKRVELREQPTKEKTVDVTLPTGNHVLADFLEANGHTEAAQAVRGFVLEWVDVK